MSNIISQRMAARMDGEFVVFLIGMRINRWWKINRWWPVAMAMPRMIRELSAQPELGFIHAEQWFGRTTLMLQYWKSFDALETYARDRNQTHLPAWAAFNRNVASNGDVGIWHETYLVRPGSYENIYNNMPAFGLGRAGELAPATTARERARQRLVAP